MFFIRSDLSVWANFTLQICLKLSLLASLPVKYGGLDGQVIYIDVESKFSSKRYLKQTRNSQVVIFLIMYFNKNIRHILVTNLHFPD